MRRVAPPVALLALAVAADVAFTHLAGHEGLLAPYGPIHVTTALSGALALALRLGATVLVLPWLAWRLTAAVPRRDG